MREAARRIHRSPETVRRWIWSGRLQAAKRGNTYYVDVMQLEGIAAEMGITWVGTEATAGSGRLAAWLEELDQWKSGLATRPAAKQTASDLVIEDRHARR